MYTTVFRVSRGRLAALRTLNGVMLVVAVVAAVGAVRGIIMNASTYQIFS